MNAKNPKKILIVCTGNCSRSVLTLGLLRTLLPKDRFQLEAAGTDANEGHPPTANTLKLIKEHKLPIEDYKARRLTLEMVQEADKILIMEKYHAKRIQQLFPGHESKTERLIDYAADVENWIREIGIPDPQGMSWAFYENVYQLVEKSCTALSKKLLTEN